MTQIAARLLPFFGTNKSNQISHPGLWMLPPIFEDYIRIKLIVPSYGWNFTQSSHNVFNLFTSAIIYTCCFIVRVEDAELITDK